MPPSKEISATHCAKFNMLVNILLLLLFVLCYCFFYYMFMFLRRLFNVWTLVRAALFYYLLSKFIVARKRCFCWFFLFVLCTSVLWPQSLRKNTKRLLLSLSLSVARSSSALLRVSVCVYVWLFAEQWMLLSTSTLPSSPLARVYVLRSTLHITRHHRCRDP